MTNGGPKQWVVRPRDTHDSGGDAIHSSQPTGCISSVFLFFSGASRLYRGWACGWGRFRSQGRSGSFNFVRTCFPFLLKPHDFVSFWSHTRDCKERSHRGYTKPMLHEKNIFLLFFLIVEDIIELLSCGPMRSASIMAHKSNSKDLAKISSQILLFSHFVK